mmetsp:Transcript_828/g.1731  ORF Transcript_828/g.1731 Transcript_828/m.1731 type:complete len:1586 (-) Transcript_828:53-4810(-)
MVNKTSFPRRRSSGQFARNADYALLYFDVLEELLDDIDGSTRSGDTIEMAKTRVATTVIVPDGAAAAANARESDSNSHMNLYSNLNLDSSFANDAAAATAHAENHCLNPNFDLVTSNLNEDNDPSRSHFPGYGIRGDAADITGNKNGYPSIATTVATTAVATPTGTGTVLREKNATTAIETEVANSHISGAFQKSSRPHQEHQEADGDALEYTVEVDFKSSPKMDQQDSKNDAQKQKQQQQQQQQPKKKKRDDWSGMTIQPIPPNRRRSSVMSVMSGITIVDSDFEDVDAELDVTEQNFPQQQQLQHATRGSNPNRPIHRAKSENSGHNYSAGTLEEADSISDLTAFLAAGFLARDIKKQQQNRQQSLGDSKSIHGYDCLGGDANIGDDNFAPKGMTRRSSATSKQIVQAVARMLRGDDFDINNANFLHENHDGTNNTETFKDGVVANKRDNISLAYMQKNGFNSSVGSSNANSKSNGGNSFGSRGIHKVFPVPKRSSSLTRSKSKSKSSLPPPKSGSPISRNATHCKNHSAYSSSDANCINDNNSLSSRKDSAVLSHASSSVFNYRDSNVLMNKRDSVSLIYRQNQVPKLSPIDSATGGSGSGFNPGSGSIALSNTAADSDGFASAKPPPFASCGNMSPFEGGATAYGVAYGSKPPTVQQQYSRTCNDIDYCRRDNNRDATHDSKHNHVWKAKGPMKKGYLSDNNIEFSLNDSDYVTINTELESMLQRFMSEVGDSDSHGDDSETMKRKANKNKNNFKSRSIGRNHNFDGNDDVDDRKISAVTGHRKGSLANLHREQYGMGQLDSNDFYATKSGNTGANGVIEHENENSTTTTEMLGYICDATRDSIAIAKRHGNVSKTSFGSVSTCGVGLADILASAGNGKGRESDAVNVSGTTSRDAPNSATRNDRCGMGNGSGIRHRFKDDGDFNPDNENDVDDSEVDSVYMAQVLSSFNRDSLSIDKLTGHLSKMPTESDVSPRAALQGMKNYASSYFKSDDQDSFLDNDSRSKVDRTTLEPLSYNGKRNRLSIAKLAGLHTGNSNGADQSPRAARGRVNISSFDNGTERDVSLRTKRLGHSSNTSSNFSDNEQDSFLDNDGDSEVNSTTMEKFLCNGTRDSLSIGKLTGHLTKFPTSSDQMSGAPREPPNVSPIDSSHHDSFLEMGNDGVDGEVDSTTLEQLLLSSANRDSLSIARLTGHLPKLATIGNDGNQGASRSPVNTDYDSDEHDSFLDDGEGVSELDSSTMERFFCNGKRDSFAVAKSQGRGPKLSLVNDDEMRAERQRSDDDEQDSLLINDGEDSEVDSFAMEQFFGNSKRDSDAIAKNQGRVPKLSLSSDGDSRTARARSNLAAIFDEEEQGSFFEMDEHSENSEVDSFAMEDYFENGKRDSVAIAKHRGHLPKLSSGHVFNQGVVRERPNISHEDAKDGESLQATDIDSDDSDSITMEGFFCTGKRDSVAIAKHKGHVPQLSIGKSISSPSNNISSDQKNCSATRLARSTQECIDFALKELKESGINFSDDEDDQDEKDGIRSTSAVETNEDSIPSDDCTGSTSSVEIQTDDDKKPSAQGSIHKINPTNDCLLDRTPEIV